MAEKLLLLMFQQLFKKGIPVDWDALAWWFEPGATGESVIQQTNKWRDMLLAEGWLLPAQGNRELLVETNIRGYVLTDENPDNLLEARLVTWDEPLPSREK